MGANSFLKIGEGSDAREVFDRLVSDAQYEYGHGGYTGTIAEKGGYGFTIVQRNPVTESEARMIAEDYDEQGRCDKWGPAFAVPLVAKSAVKRRTRKVTVSVPSETDYLTRERIKALLQGKVALKPGERIADTKVVKDDRTYAASVQTCEGAVQKRFFVVPKGKMELRGEGHATQALARKALTDLVKDHARRAGEDRYGFRSDQEWEIMGVLRRDTGQGLVSGKVSTRSRKATIEVEIVKDLKTRPETTGWLFFGSASS